MAHGNNQLRSLIPNHLPLRSSNHNLTANKQANKKELKQVQDTQLKDIFIKLNEQVMLQKKKSIQEGVVQQGFK